jgi:PAS domain S-box-containing protein
MVDLPTSSQPDEVLDSFVRVVGRIQQSAGFDELWQSMIGGLCELTGAPWGSIRARDERGTGYRAFSHNLKPGDETLFADPTQALDPLGLNAELAAWVGVHGGGLNASWERLDAPSSTVAPIRIGREVVGTITLGGKQPLTFRDQLYLQLFAGQAAVAIHNRMRDRKLRDQLHEIQAQRARLRAIMTSLPHGLVYVEPSSGLVEANPKAAEMLGFSLNSMDDLSLLEGRCCLPDGRALPTVELPLMRALRGETVTGEEHLIVHPDGTTIPVVWGAAPMEDEQGNIKAAVAQFQDVRHMAEAKLRIEELSAERARLLSLAEHELHRLQALLDAVPVGVIILEGQEGRTKLFNEELSRILGFGPLGEPFAAYAEKTTMRRPDGTAYRLEERPVARALFKGETVRGEELTVELADGREVPVVAHAAPLYGPEGAVTGAISILEDRSPLAELERQRAEFVAMVGHELKNPLAVIKGLASVVRSRHGTLAVEEVAELLGSLEHQADRLQYLLDDLLDITRLESGSFTIEAEPARLDALITEACTQFAAAGGIQEVKREIAAGLPILNVDHRRATQVLLNFLTNAGKFSYTFSPVVVAAEQIGSQVKVTVTDQGLGIAEEDLPRLFHKFSQIHAGSSQKGSGLGLAICKGIVEAHGGTVWAESAGVGHGSTFGFTLPIWNDC